MSCLNFGWMARRKAMHMIQAHQASWAQFGGGGGRAQLIGTFQLFLNFTLDFSDSIKSQVKERHLTFVYFEKMKITWPRSS